MLAAPLFDACQKAKPKLLDEAEICFFFVDPEAGIPTLCPEKDTGVLVGLTMHTRDGKAHCGFGDSLQTALYHLLEKTDDMVFTEPVSTVQAAYDALSKHPLLQNRLHKAIMFDNVRSTPNEDGTPIALQCIPFASNPLASLKACGATYEEALIDLHCKFLSIFSYNACDENLYATAHVLENCLLRHGLVDADTKLLGVRLRAKLSFEENMPKNNAIRLRGARRKNHKINVTGNTLCEAVSHFVKQNAHCLHLVLEPIKPYPSDGMLGVDFDKKPDYVESTICREVLALKKDPVEGSNLFDAKFAYYYIVSDIEHEPLLSIRVLDTGRVCLKTLDTASDKLIEVECDTFELALIETALKLRDHRNDNIWNETAWNMARLASLPCYADPGNGLNRNMAVEYIAGSCVIRLCLPGTASPCFAVGSSFKEAVSNLCCVLEPKLQLLETKKLRDPQAFVQHWNTLSNDPQRMRKDYAKYRGMYHRPERKLMETLEFFDTIASVSKKTERILFGEIFCTVTLVQFWFEDIVWSKEGPNSYEIAHATRNDGGGKDFEELLLHYWNNCYGPAEQHEEP